MANIFAITTATEEIKADKDGKARAVFTVTNNSHKPVRGIAKAKVLGNTQQDWLDVEGETERDFAASGTQQYTVNFHKTAAGAAGATEKFPFRLDVASASNPDEQFTEGPTVTVEVTSAPSPVTKKPFPWWLIAVIVGGLLIVALILFLLLQRGCRSDEPVGNSNNTGNNSNTNNLPTIKNIQGMWRFDNSDPKYTFLAQMSIGQDGKTVQVKLLCQFIVCDDWGVGEGKIAGDTATVDWKNEAVTGQLKLTLLEPNRLVAEGEFKSGIMNPTVKAIYIREQ